MCRQKPQRGAVGERGRKICNPHLSKKEDSLPNLTGMISTDVSIRKFQIPLERDEQERLHALLDTAIDNELVVGVELRQAKTVRCSLKTALQGSVTT